MKKLPVFIISLVMIFILNSCAENKVKKEPEIILKASFSSPMDTFAYCFELTDNKKFVTEYGEVQRESLKGENYIKPGKKEQITLSNDQYSELLNLADNFYNDREAINIGGDDGASLLTVLYKDTEITTDYAEPISVVNAFSEKLIELSPLTVDFSIQNGAELDVENCEWASENLKLSFEKVESDFEYPGDPKYKLLLSKGTDTEEYYFYFVGSSGSYYGDNHTYQCFFEFWIKPIDSEEFISSGEGEYFANRIMLNEWGEADLFEEDYNDYKEVTFERVKL